MLFSSTLPASYLCEKGLVDLHALVRALRQDLSATVPAVADRRVGIGHAAKEHRPLVVELFLSFSYALMHRHRRVIKVCESSTHGAEEEPSIHISFP